MRILLPLCGKSVDLLWLWRHGHDVVGVEDFAKSISDFAADSHLVPEDVNNNKSQDEEMQAIKECIGAEEMLSLLQSSFSPSNASGSPFTDHSFNAVWDRSAFVSMPPRYHGFYAEAIKRLLNWHDFRFMLLVYEFDETAVKGPPYAVTQDRVRALFQDFADIHRIYEAPLLFDARLSGSNQFSLSKTDVREVVYLLRNK